MLLQPTASRPRQAVWSLGFRPFFLGGSLFALIALLLWAGVLAGALAPACLLYTSPSPRDQRGSRMPSSA